jgi:hypothetical protein
MANGILKKLACPQCGAPLDIHNANTQTIVCPKCQSYVAIGMDDASVIAGATKFTSSVPIEIGSYAELDGTRFFVLGHVQYEGWDTNDRSDRWTWDEYLLGGDDGRMLWLSHDEKGFGLYTKQRLTGEFDITRSRTIPTRDGKQVAVHERYPAHIVGARGELTWRARPQDTLFMAEGAHGGKRYSVQQSDEELEIYEGALLDTLQVAQAFGDEAWVQRIKAKKARKQTAAWAAAICILFAVMGGLMAAYFNGVGERVSQEAFNVTTLGQPMTFNVELDQVNRPAIITLSTPRLPSNTFADFDVSVTSPNGITTFLFEKTVWHETGVDSDGAWAENSYSVSNMFVPTVAGTHIIEILPDVGTTAPLPLEMALNVRRNHITPLWLVVYAVFAGIIGMIAFFRSII